MEKPSRKDVSNLRGFFDYVETISTDGVNMELYDSVKIEETSSLLMKEEPIGKSLTRYKALEELQNPCDKDNEEEINWKLNENNRCAICQVQLPSQISLDRHIVDLHLGTTGRFHCDICQKEFSRLSDLVGHKLTHSGVKPFQCSTCREQFSKQDHLKQHIFSHLQCSNGEFYAFENGLNRCNICHKQLSRPQHLRTHMRQHLGTLFECDKCSKRFSRASHLRMHMRVHLGTCFRCNICKKEFSRPSDLDRHKLTHLDEKLFQCPTCNKKFSRKDNLKKHMVSHVESVLTDKQSQNSFEITETKYECLNSKKNYQRSICTAEPSLLFDFTTHAIIQSDIKCYECYICKKYFSRKDHLKRHLNSHKICARDDGVDFFECKESEDDKRLLCTDSSSLQSKEKINSCNISEEQFEYDKNSCVHDSRDEKFGCNICDKRFQKKVRLKKHVRLQGEGNSDQNKCDICDKQLSRPEHLRAHMRLHLGTLFKCETCEKEFSRSSDLDRHMLVHSGLKQFICIICHKQFSRKDYLKNHMLSHANQKSFECDKCKKRFNYFTNLRNHLLLHIGD